MMMVTDDGGTNAKGVSRSRLLSGLHKEIASMIWVWIALMSRFPSSPKSQSQSDRLWFLYIYAMMLQPIKQR